MVPTAEVGVVVVVVVGLVVVAGLVAVAMRSLVGGRGLSPGRVKTSAATPTKAVMSAAIPDKMPGRVVQKGLLGRASVEPG